MQYQVPQFIEIEDKIFGPLTAKQFFYLLGGGALIFIMYIFLQLWLVIILGIPVVGFVGSLAFLKINGIPFIKILSNALGFATSSRLYLWKKVEIKKIEEEIKLPSEMAQNLPMIAPRLTENKLQDLAWSLDIQQKIKR